MEKNEIKDLVDAFSADEYTVSVRLLREGIAQIAGTVWQAIVSFCDAKGISIPSPRDFFAEMEARGYPMWVFWPGTREETKPKVYICKEETIDRYYRRRCPVRCTYDTADDTVQMAMRAIAYEDRE